MDDQMIFYRGSSNWYMRIVHVKTGKVWDYLVGALSATVVWVNSYTVLTFSVTIGGHVVEMPVGLPDGRYDLLFYNAASPSSSDTLEVGYPTDISRDYVL